MEITNFEFTITFGIRKKENPGWNLFDSEINFPQFTLDKGILVYCKKFRGNFLVFILHPELGYRKIKADISNYIGKDTFVAITNTKEITKLYLNAELIAEFQENQNLNSIELGDIVMTRVNNIPLNNFKFQGKMDVLLPAEIKEIKGDKISVYFFDINELANARIRDLKFL